MPWTNRRYSVGDRVLLLAAVPRGFSYSDYYVNANALRVPGSHVTGPDDRDFQPAIMEGIITGTSVYVPEDMMTSPSRAVSASEFDRQQAHWNEPSNHRLWKLGIRYMLSSRYHNTTMDYWFNPDVIRETARWLMANPSITGPDKSALLELVVPMVVVDRDYEAMVRDIADTVISGLNLPSNINRSVSGLNSDVRSVYADIAGRNAMHFRFFPNFLATPYTQVGRESSDQEVIERLYNETQAALVGWSNDAVASARQPGHPFRADPTNLGGQLVAGSTADGVAETRPVEPVPQPRPHDINYWAIPEPSVVEEVFSGAASTNSTVRISVPTASTPPQTDEATQEDSD